MASKFAPIVLSIVGSIGVITTAMLAIKATPKAMDIVKKEKIKPNEPEKVIKATWKCYVPTVVSAGVTIAAIAGAGILSERQITAVTGAYGVLQNTYKNYIHEVKERFGVDVHNDIVASIAAERSAQEHITCDSFFQHTSLEFEDADEEEVLFYDKFGDRYFTSTFSSVLQAEYHLNRNFCLGGCVTLNDFYELLGIEKTEDGNNLAWSAYDCEYYWIDFNHIKSSVKATMNSSEEAPCYVIEMVLEPEILE